MSKGIFGGKNRKIDIELIEYRPDNLLTFFVTSSGVEANSKYGSHGPDPQTIADQNDYGPQTQEHFCAFDFAVSQTRQKQYEPQVQPPFLDLCQLH